MRKHPDLLPGMCVSSGTSAITHASDKVAAKAQKHYSRLQADEPTVQQRFSGIISRDAALCTSSCASSLFATTNQHAGNQWRKKVGVMTDCGSSCELCCHYYCRHYYCCCYCPCITTVFLTRGHHVTWTLGYRSSIP